MLGPNSLVVVYMGPLGMYARKYIVRHWTLEGRGITMLGEGLVSSRLSIFERIHLYIYIYVYTESKHKLVERTYTYGGIVWVSNVDH